jgi:hypothetical protein
MAPPALLANVTTALIDDVVPTAVLGNEKAAGLTVNCVVVAGAAGVVAAPRAPEELEMDNGAAVELLDATVGRGRLPQPGVSEVHTSNTAIESQWLRLRSIRDSHIKSALLITKASKPAWTRTSAGVNLIRGARAHGGPDSSPPFTPATQNHV